MKFWSKALEIARASSEKAYCPYSHFKVGAAVQFKGHKEIYGGCNVENGSYGGTICAERGAILGAIAQEGAGTIDYIVVYSRTDQPIPPCGLCLQVIGEFSGDETAVILVNEKGDVMERTFSALLPSPFHFHQNSD